MQELFSFDFSSNQKSENKKSQLILSKLEDIDKWIKDSAPKWDVKKINRIDLAILRLAVYELMVEKKNPPRVTVDESVELAKEYGSDASPGFVNGALGKLIADNKLLN
jgi:N utilization substance protein B